MTRLIASEFSAMPNTCIAVTLTTAAPSDVATEHGARRSVILAELQAFAASVGLLSGPAAPLAHEFSRSDSSKFAIQHENRLTDHEVRPLAASFEEELCYHLNGRSATG